MREEFSENSHGGCGRGAEMVAYLYGEAGPEEERLFAAHLSTCAVCREEFAALGVVRAGLGEWREEALSAAPPIEVAAHLPAARRTALDALREFFTLTPLWLKAGGAFAAVAVCALAALAVLRAEVRWDERGLAFSTGGGAVRTVETTREVQAPGTYTEQQLNELADARVRAALEEQAAASRRVGASDAAAAGDAPAKRPEIVNVRAERQPRRGTKALARRTEPAATRDEFQPDDNLPGLYDLLRGAN